MNDEWRGHGGWFDHNMLALADGTLNCDRMPPAAGHWGNNSEEKAMIYFGGGHADG